MFAIGLRYFVSRTKIIFDLFLQTDNGAVVAYDLMTEIACSFAAHYMVLKHINVPLLSKGPLYRRYQNKRRLPGPRDGWADMYSDCSNLCIQLSPSFSSPILQGN